MTLTEFYQGGYSVHPSITHIQRNPDGSAKEKEIIKIGQSSSDGSQGGMVYSGKGVAMTLCAAFHGYAMGFVLRKYESNKRDWKNREQRISEQ